MAALESTERPNTDDDSIEPHVLTVVDGVISAFDLFGVQGLRRCPRCIRPSGKARPDAVTRAWITLGNKMYQVMGHLAAETVDERR